MRRISLQWGIPLGCALLLICIAALSGSAANAQYPGPAPARGNPVAAAAVQGNLGLPAAPAVGTPCGVTTTITGSLDGTDATEAQRLTHSVTGSTCAAPVACPGASFATGPFTYDTYTFSNTTNSAQCVTVQLTTACDLESATYLTAYDPANLCANYLAVSPGSTFSGTVTYSFSAPALSDFVVVVNAIDASTLCPSYTLRVGGCPVVVPTDTPTNTPTNTAVVPTDTPTNTPTDTAVVPTHTPTNTPTDTAVVPTHTPTNTPTNTAVVPTHTPTNTPTGTLIVPTNTPTHTPTGTAVVPTNTPTHTPTGTAVVPTNTPTGTTGTAVPSLTATPTATATPNVNCPLPFTDVDQFNPFYQFIQCLYCRGIISGYSDNTFRWGVDVTRGQVSKIIANAAGLNDVIPSGQQTFTDVPPANPFYVFIERLAGRGYISGYDTAANCPTGVPCFRWELPVTRGQLAKIDANAAGYNETPTGQAFNDVPAANPFYVWIERLSLHGVINGYTCGGPGEPCPGVYYRPFANITRGQVSKVAAQSFFPNACAPARR